jgi:hypothetical protein
MRKNVGMLGTPPRSPRQRPSEMLRAIYQGSKFSCVVAAPFGGLVETVEASGTPWVIWLLNQAACHPNHVA